MTRIVLLGGIMSGQVVDVPDDATIFECLELDNHPMAQAGPISIDGPNDFDVRLIPHQYTIDHDKRRGVRV